MGEVISSELVYLDDDVTGQVGGDSLVLLLVHQFQPFDDAQELGVECAAEIVLVREYRLQRLQIHLPEKCRM